MSKHQLVAASAAVALAVAGCGGGSSSSSSTPSSPSASGSTTAAPSTSAPSTPSSTTASPSTGPRPTARVRTSAELTKALLALKDLPSGFSIDTGDQSDDDPELASTNPRCAPFVSLMNAERPPGSRASADRSFSGGQNGPFVDESLDAMGTPQAVAALQHKLKAAVAACPKVTLTLRGQGSSPISVKEVSAPKSGDNPFAVRLTATRGALAGLEVTMVTTGVSDVIAALTLVGAASEDVDGATEAAVGKAEDVLKVRTAGG